MDLSRLEKNVMSVYFNDNGPQTFLAKLLFTEKAKKGEIWMYIYNQRQNNDIEYRGPLNPRKLIKHGFSDISNVDAVQSVITKINEKLSHHTSTGGNPTNHGAHTYHPPGLLVIWKHYEWIPMKKDPLIHIGSRCLSIHLETDVPVPS